MAENGDIVAPRPSKVSNIERKLITKNNQDKKTISIEKLNKMHFKNQGSRDIARRSTAEF